MKTENSYLNNKNLKKSRTKIRRLLLWFFILVSLFTGLFYFAGHFDLLSVQELNVSNVFFAEEDEVLNKIIANSISSSFWKKFVGPGNILFWKFEKNSECQFLDLPSVRSVDLQTNLATRSVQINIEEREIFGVWCLPIIAKNTEQEFEQEFEKEQKRGKEKIFGDCYGFDKGGIIFTVVPEVRGNLILKVEDSTGRNLQLGQRVLPNEEWLIRIEEYLENLKSFGLKVENILVKNLEFRDWNIKVRNGPELRFSFNFNISDLDSLLNQLVENFDFFSRSYVDFRVENRIFYR